MDLFLALISFLFKRSLFFNKLGIIEYADKDSYYYDIGNKAIKWIQEVNSDKEFTHNPPNDSRIYPNMTNKFDGIYHNVKSQMAKKLYEIFN